MSTIKPLYAGDLPMAMGGGMSGSGSNLWKIAEAALAGGYAFFATLFSDETDPEKCRIMERAEEMDPSGELGRYVLQRNIDAFYRSNGLDDRRHPINSFEERRAVRKEFDQLMAADIEGVACERGVDIDVVVLGGYMSFVTEPIFEGYVTINVHPGDLTAVAPSGRRRYTGDAAVRRAILAGEPQIHACTHLVTAEVDYGPIIFRSAGLQVDIPTAWGLAQEDAAEDGFALAELPGSRDYAEWLLETHRAERADSKPKTTADYIADAHQGKLKEVGDWVVFPMTVEAIARQQLQYTVENGRTQLYHNGEPIPDGIHLRGLEQLGV